MKKYPVFFAISMEHQTPEQLDLAWGLVQQIEAEFGEIFYAPRTWPTPESYLPHEESFKVVKEGLLSSQLFLLYYPHKVVSGALTELGMALAYDIPSIAYTLDVNNLPYMFRGGLHNLEVTTNPHNLWPLIQHYLSPR